MLIRSTLIAGCALALLFGVSAASAGVELDVPAAPDAVSLLSSTLTAHVSGSTLMGQFTPDGAGGGALAATDTTSVYVDAACPATYENALIAMMLTLDVDSSAGGLASGLFSGSVTITDADAALLLSAVVADLVVSEVPGVEGLLAGQGDVTITGGELATLFPGGVAELTQTTFGIGGLDDFSQGGLCLINVTLSAVPEPASMLLLAAGGLAAIRKRRA